MEDSDDDWFRNGTLLGGSHIEIDIQCGQDSEDWITVQSKSTERANEIVSIILRGREVVENDRLVQIG